MRPNLRHPPFSLYECVCVCECVCVDEDFDQYYLSIALIEVIPFVGFATAVGHGGALICFDAVTIFLIHS